MLAYLSATRIFRSRDHESSQYARVRVGFNRLNFDSDKCTDYGRTSYRSSSEASFRHCIWGKFHNGCQVLLLPSAMSPKGLLIEKTCGRPTLYDLACEIIHQYQRFSKQPMSCPWRAERVRASPPHKYWPSTWLVSCFRLLKLLFLDLVFDLPISLWSILFNSLSNYTPSRVRGIE